MWYVFVMADFEAADYTEDWASFGTKIDGKSFVEELKISFLILFMWLMKNYMKANTDMNNLLLSENNDLKAKIDEIINQNAIESENHQVFQAY